MYCGCVDFSYTVQGIVRPGKEVKQFVTLRPQTGSREQCSGLLALLHAGLNIPARKGLPTLTNAFKMINSSLQALPRGPQPR